MSRQEHVESLRSKHLHLEQLIDDEMHRPLPDQSTLSRLKREKLHIKEEIERTGHNVGPVASKPSVLMN